MERASASNACRAMRGFFSAIRMRQMGPKERQRGGVRFAEIRFQFQAQRAQRRRRCLQRFRLHRLGRFLALVGDPIEPAVGAASAGDEIHRTILWRHRDVGDGQTRGAQKGLRLAGVGRSLRLQMHDKQPPITPITGEEGVLVFCRKFRAVTKTNTGR